MEDMAARKTAASPNPLAPAPTTENARNGSVLAHATKEPEIQEQSPDTVLTAMRDKADGPSTAPVPKRRKQAPTSQMTITKREFKQGSLLALAKQSSSDFDKAKKDIEDNVFQHLKHNTKISLGNPPGSAHPEG